MARNKKGMTQLVEAANFVAGLTQSPPPGVKSVMIAGESYTIAQLITEAQGIQQINQAVVDGKTKWKAAQVAAEAQNKTNRMLLTGMRRVLIDAYGSDTSGLGACGIVVNPAAPRDSKTNAIAAARAVAVSVKIDVASSVR